MPPAPKPVAERLLRHVEVQPNGCWRWTGAGKGNGYGIIGIPPRRVVSVHRVAYEMFYGPIPEGHQVDHLCHALDASCPGGFACVHRRCVNPVHLEAVSGPENRRRGLGFAGRQSRQTHCIHGHPFDETNTYVHRGRRLCRQCSRDRRARYGAAA